jgi:hypothetical protein
VVKRSKRSGCAKFRCAVERLENRELLSTLIEGSAANNLTGTTVAPVGNIFDDSSAGMVGDDFAISAPGARGNAGDVYIVFGGSHLDPQPPALQGCIAPPTRALSCSLIDTYLANHVALRILGDEPGDLFGYSVTGVGDVIGDSRPDVLIGAPFAFNSGFESSGRAYLIGGEVIASVISAARTGGGTTVATIDLSQPILDTTTIRIFDGFSAGDEAGNSVSGLGTGYFIVSAPLNGAAPKLERGAVYVFAPLRGVTGNGVLTPIATVRGPSLGAHLGGVPASELLSTGFRGYGVSGIRNPALIPVADDNVSQEARYSVIGNTTPDVLVGAPDACVDNDCTTLDAERHGIGYLLSGTGLITVGGTYDLSSDVDLKALDAIPVQGADNGDRFGAAVSSAGNLDGDSISDFMFGAPNRDIPGPTPGSGLPNAGEVYVVFGREVLTTPFPDGECQGDPGRPGGQQQNFRQCRDATGLVVPLDAGSFSQTGTSVGLILRGESANERAGAALADAGNFVDPLGRTALTNPAPVGVNEIVIGAPFHDLVLPSNIFPAAGRAYVVFGTTEFQLVSGQIANLGLLDDSARGQVIDGRESNGHYGISVNAAGNAFDPTGVTGGDLLIGANQVDVALATGVALNAGEVEIFFGSTGGGGGGGLFPISALPFVQPGTFGPQIYVGGYWSFTNTMPPAGNVVYYPLVPSRPSDILLNPPATNSLVPAGAVGPFVSAFPLGAPMYLPGQTRAKKGKLAKKIAIVTPAALEGEPDAKALLRLAKRAAKHSDSLTD